MSKVPSGGSATVVVRGGTYREGRITVPAGRAVRLRAFPGEVPTFVGSQPVSSAWVTEGSLRYQGYTPQPVTNGSGMSFSSGQGLTGDGAGKFPDQAWVGSQQLRQVAAKSSVVAGTFWVDQSNKRIYLHGTDAAKGGVEVSSLDVFLTIQGADSVVEGLRVARFSNSADDYGVVKLLGAADRTVVRDVEITDAAFQAFMLAGEESTSGILEGVVLENLTISRANWMGISSNMVGNLTMRRLWIAHLNQFKEFTNAPQSGAFKASRNRNVKFVDGVVENNNGHGVWFDQSSYDAEVAGNRITGNWGRVCSSRSLMGWCWPTTTSTAARGSGRSSWPVPPGWSWSTTRSSAGATRWGCTWTAGPSRAVPIPASRCAPGAPPRTRTRSGPG